MARKHSIFRVQHTDEGVIERTREITKQSRQVLRDNPTPDTFAGRKTQEPFPMQDDEIERWLISKELQPQT